tara:strand:- start:777 stop:1169 length:393 start_codon:yes stop_codon:yes gene_type:complete
MGHKRFPNIRQFERGFLVTPANEDNPLGTFVEFDQVDEHQHRHSGTSLKFKQALVGGNIEPLHFAEYYRGSLSDDHEDYFWDIYGNEDASFQYNDEDPPRVNMRASTMLGYEVYGNIIFVPRSWRLEDEG